MTGIIVGIVIILLVCIGIGIAILIKAVKFADRLHKTIDKHLEK